MPVGDFARSFWKAVYEEGTELQVDVTVPWLSGKGHRDPFVQDAPNNVLTRLSQIYAMVGGVEALLEAKRPSRCGVDFQLDERTYVELDEVQHFSSARLKTLDSYDGLEHSTNVEAYRESCRRFRSEADRAWAKRIKNEFDFVGGRTSQRAYLDAARDLLAPCFGCRLLRIPAPEGSLRLALDRFHAIL